MFNIAGLHGLARDSAGGITLLAKHPRYSLTWHWSVSIGKRNGRPFSRAKRRTGQWSDYYWLPFGLHLIVSFQDWHKG